MKREVNPTSLLIKAYNTQKFIDAYNKNGIFFKNFYTVDFRRVPMSDPPNRTNPSKCEPGRLVLTLSAIACYILSIGPVAWLDRSRLVPKPVMDAVLQVYFPMDWLYDHSDRFRDLFEWYLRLWW